MEEWNVPDFGKRTDPTVEDDVENDLHPPDFGKRTDPTVEDDVENDLHPPDFRKRKLWTDPTVEDENVEIDLRPPAEIPLKQLQTEEVKVNGEEITRGVGQFIVKTGGHDSIQLDDTESDIMEDDANMVTMEGQANMVTMEGQANNVIMKVKSLVTVDDVTATGEILAITFDFGKRTDPTVEDDVENDLHPPDFRKRKLWTDPTVEDENLEIDLRPPGFIRLCLILSLFPLMFCGVNGNQTETKVDWQSDSLLHVFGGTWNLKCSKNDSIENETGIWSRRDLMSGETDAINLGTTPNNPAKFKIIDGGSTLEIKNLTEGDITDYCYYSRMGTTPSKCKNMLDQNNTVVIPSKAAVTFDKKKKEIQIISGCYPNLTFLMIIQGSVVANQTATKKDNGLYEVDMIFNGTLKNGEQFLVVARHGNKNFTVYNSTDVQIIKQEEDSSRINIGLIVVGVVVSIVVISIVVWRRWRRDRNDTNNGKNNSMENVYMLGKNEPNGCPE